jgi:CRISPR-associated protein Cas1
MGYSTSALELRKPRVIELPRLGHRISYLYIDYARITQDRTGVIAIQEEDGKNQMLRIPIASIGFILLGPGTSVTTPAMISLHRAGTTVVFTSSHGVSGFAMAKPLTGRADWVQAQARCWSSETGRLAAARSLYEIQLGALDMDTDTPLRVLRGIEGSRVRSLYKTLAKQYRLGKWQRETDPEKYSDPVNPLLNLGGAILYGAATSAVGALGMSPSLGFIHNGATNALLFDLADIYKHRSSIPLAFMCAKQADPAAALRAEMRKFLYEKDVLDSLIKVLCTILEPHLGPAERARDSLIDDSGAVPGHVNYSQNSDINIASSVTTTPEN